MAVPVARVHLKMAHAALPALLPTPPKWKPLQQMLPSSPWVSAAIPNPPRAKPSRADSVERWDAHKLNKPGYSAASPSSGPRSAVRSSAGCGSPPRKNATSPPPPKPGRADAVERWDAHKKAASLASSTRPSSSSSGTSSSSKWPTISRATSAERWDVHKQRCPARTEQLDDGESSSTGSNDIDAEEEEILWKPRAMYAGPGFAVAAPQPSMIPMPTAFLVPVA